MNDTLNTIAEISVAVVGFVAIVSALRRDTPQAGIERVLLINVRAEPIAVVMFALLPGVLAPLATHNENNLRISLGLFAVAHLFLTYWVYARFSPHFGVAFPRLAPTVVCGFAAVLCLIQLIVAAGYYLAYLEFLYLLGLYWLLAMCFLNFLILFLRRDQQSG